MYIVHALHPSMTFLFRSESFFAYFSTFCCALQMSTDNYLQAKDNTPLHDTHFKPSLSMKILSLNDFINTLLSNFVKGLSAKEDYDYL